MADAVKLTSCWVVMRFLETFLVISPLPVVVLDGSDLSAQRFITMLAPPAA